MRLARTLGLALIAALAAMAFAGAGTASAENGTILCHLGEGAAGHCPAGSLPYTGKILALGGASETLGWSLFQSGFVHIECNTEMHGEVTSAGGLGKAPHGLINNVLFTQCKSPTCVHGVTAQPHGLPWLAKASVGKEELLGDGFLHVEKHAGGGTVGGLFICKYLIFGIPAEAHCLYSIEGTSALALLDGHLKHGLSKLLANEIKLEKLAPSSGSCSNTATWNYLPYVDSYEGEKAEEDLSLHLLKAV